MSLLQFVPRNATNENNFLLAETFLDFVKTNPQIFDEVDLYKVVTKKIDALRLEQTNKAAEAKKLAQEEEKRQKLEQKQQEEQRAREAEEARKQEKEEKQNKEKERQRLEAEKLAKEEEEKKKQQEAQRAREAEKARKQEEEENQKKEKERQRLEAEKLAKEEERVKEAEKAKKQEEEKAEQERLAKLLLPQPKKTNTTTATYQVMYKANVLSIETALKSFEKTKGLDTSLIAETKRRLEAPTSKKDTLKALFTIQPSF